MRARGCHRGVNCASIRMIGVLRDSAAGENEYREKACDYIAARVRQWSAEQMSVQIELGIGAHLQYIRYTGT